MNDVAATLGSRGEVVLVEPRRPVTWAAGLDRQHRRFPLFREPASPVSDNMADSRARAQDPSDPPGAPSMSPLTQAECVDARMMLHLDKGAVRTCGRPAARPARDERRTFAPDGNAGVRPSQRP